MKTKNRFKRKSKAEILTADLNEHDTKIAMIQMLIPLGLEAVKCEFEKELINLVGKKYSRNESDFHRWGKNPGSVYLGDQKVKIKVPRIVHKETGESKGLASYTSFQHPRIIDESILKKVVYGLSQRRFQEAAIDTAESFGISRSSVSRKFKRASATKLTQLLERDLSHDDVIAIIMDGKKFAEMGIIVALGVDMEGHKKFLGLIESGAENSRVVEDFLQDLINRGLKTENEILFVVDGAKGFQSGIKNKFGKKATIQRCQWHKRENVISYLPKKHKDNFRDKLRRAYSSENYEKAKQALQTIKKELKLLNESAVKSLEEGFEETLTLHRLGVFKEVGESLKTTNCIESVFSQVEQYTSRVDYWKNSNQRQRWVATSLLDIEKRLRRIKGHQSLNLLRRAMKNKMVSEMKKAA